MFHGSFVAAILALFLALSAPPGVARPLGERAEPGPVVAGLVEELQQELGRKSPDTAQAKQLVERLAVEFAVSGTKDRGPIVRVLELCLAAKRQGKPDGELVCHAARALAGMAPESLPVLLRTLDNKALLKDEEIGRTVVLALGKTRDKTAVKPLLGVLESGDAVLVTAAGEALGEHEGAPLATRKQIFEGVLKALLQAQDQRETQAQGALDPSAPHDDAALKRSDALLAALGSTLQKLSKQESRNPDLWLRWWNKNKRANWDDKSKLG
jgi:HEAT repeat protein